MRATCQPQNRKRVSTTSSPRLAVPRMRIASSAIPTAINTSPPAMNGRLNSATPSAPHEKSRPEASDRIRPKSPVLRSQKNANTIRMMPTTATRIVLRKPTRNARPKVLAAL